MHMKENRTVVPKDLLTAVKDIKLAILQSRARAAQSTNVEALKLYLYVGGYVSRKTRRAKWGVGAIDALSCRLQVELPGLRGFSPSSIKRMRSLFEEWNKVMEFRPSAMGERGDGALVAIRPLAMGELTNDDLAAFLSVGFTHHSLIVEKVKPVDERWYYIRRAAKESWTVDELRSHLRADDYRHVGAIPNNFGKTLSPIALASRAVRSFRDEYLLELVNLDNADVVYDQDVDERVLSKALVANIEKTIQALGGSDFCFMGREKRLVVEGEELFVDLLFYHRGLKAMVAFELKMGKFRPSYLGQLSTYLSALDKIEKKPDENPSVGILLCEKMNKPFVQLAVQDFSKPIGIATYQTLRTIPKPYRELAPVIEGVRKALMEPPEASGSAGR